MEWREEWLEQDLEKGEPGERRMMREVQKMANSLQEDIQLTVDIPEDHEDKKLPVLDLRMWVEDRVGEEGEKYQEILHQYYEKEMVAPRVIGW